MTQFRVSVALGGILSLALAACGGESKPPESAATTTSTVEAPPPPAETPPAETAAPATASEKPPAEAAPAAAAPKPEPLTDEQIIMVSDLANSAEIDQAKAAQGKAKDARVKKFAAMMVSDHGGAKQKQAKLVTKLKLKPADSPLATQLKTDTTSALSTLKTTAAPDFDRAYMGAQVDGHKKVLDTINNELIPNAKNAELKALLEEMRPTVEAHLKQAQEIQQALASAPAAEEKPSTPAKTATPAKASAPGASPATAPAKK
jgi:putative membrane protein